MTQKEAVVKALETLGGKGRLRDITLLALATIEADWSGTRTPEASVRRIVRNTEGIVALGNGEYELASYKSTLDRLSAKVESLEDEVQQLKQVTTAEELGDVILEKIKMVYKYKSDKVIDIRTVLLMANMNELVDKLDEWLEQCKPQTYINIQAVNDIHGNEHVSAGL